MKTYGGEKKHVYVVRMECKHCETVETALPEQLTPHKHYASEVIENVIDEVCTPSTIQTLEYPCERTMQKWIGEFNSKRTQIEGYLRSIGNEVTSTGTKLLEAGSSLLDKLRIEGAGWLSAVNRVIYNSGGFLAAGTYPPAFSCVNSEDALCSPEKEEESDNEERRNSEVAGRGSAPQVPDHQSAAGYRNRSG